MVTDAALDFYHSKAAESSLIKSAILHWVESSAFERYFTSWRSRMYREMIEMADLGDSSDLYVSAILYDPPSFGFTYSLYKAMTSERRLKQDWKLSFPDLADIKTDL